MKAEVKYNHFLECCDLTEKDEYWKSIFYNCACGKFPKYTTYKIDGDCHSITVRYEEGKKFKHHTTNLSPISEEDTESLFVEMMDIFRNFLYLKSDLDLKDAHDQIEEIRVQNFSDLNCEWVQIKPKQLKDHFLLNYAINQTKKYNLKPNNYLYKLLKYGFQMKYLTSKNVTYVSGVVTHISGVIYDAQVRNFRLTNMNNVTPVKSDESTRFSSEAIKNSDTVEKAITKWIKDSV